MKTIQALLVAAVCIQAAGAVKLKQASLTDIYNELATVTKGKWNQLDGGLSTIAVADDKTIIGTNSIDDIYVRNGIEG